MSGLAVFSLKFPSLLQFDKSKASEKIKRNLFSLFQVKEAPSDTHMRLQLDEVEATSLRPAFKKIFSLLQRGKVLEQYRYLDGHYLISIDGTGQYSSDKTRCEECCEKHHKNGRIEYYHQMLGACIVHPDNAIVIPLAPEPITKQDGINKNDCERNAANPDISQRSGESLNYPLRFSLLQTNQDDFHRDKVYQGKANITTLPRQNY